MKKLSILSLILIYSVFSYSQTKITFINPGKSSEEFWINVSNFMRAAAEDLDLNLEIIYAERSSENVEIITDSLIRRKIKPDYLIIVNENLEAPEIIEISDLNKINTFLIYNDLNSEQKEELLEPRVIYDTWLGTLTPDNFEAGYLLADYLIKNTVKEKEKLNMIAISANQITPSSIERLEGLKLAVFENNNIELLETIYANWDEKQAYELTKNMLDKYNDIDIIWSVNDPAAQGAIRAIKEYGLEPGKDIIIGGINWDFSTLDRIKNDEMLCSVGGHFMIGAWTLVMLKDLSEGIDFVDETKITELKINIFETIDRENVETYLSYFPNSNWNKINFRNFSKFYNTNIENYNFNYDKIVENIE